uniref:Globin family profile domain-containing protein n=1 Tax=Plectus sambesii TaxID=2011161 RepID=A0A914WQ38_9BILA
MGNRAAVLGKNNSDGIVDKKMLTSAEKKMLMAEWPRLIKHNPDMFRTVWIRAFERSTAIKVIFGIKGDEKVENDPIFVRLTLAVQAFFHRLLVTEKLNDDTMILLCKQLGARHALFQSRGFQAMFWDIFMVCMNDMIDETLSNYMTGSQRVLMLYVWQRFVHLVVDHMRIGYMTRRRSTFAPVNNTNKSLLTIGTEHMSL